MSERGCVCVLSFVNILVFGDEAQNILNTSRNTAGRYPYSFCDTSWLVLLLFHDQESPRFNCFCMKLVNDQITPLIFLALCLTHLDFFSFFSTY